MNNLKGYRDMLDRLPPPQEFARQMNLWLLDREVTQRQLAQKAGVAHSQLSRWLAGRVDPSLESMIRLAAAMEELDDEPS